MTTIMTDGTILLADTRGTSTTDKGLNKPNDGVVKLFDLRRLDCTINKKKAVAWMGAGKAAAIRRFDRMITASAGHAVDLSWLIRLADDGRMMQDTTIVVVTEDNTVTTIVIDAEKITVGPSALEKGRSYVAEGSGSTIVKMMHRVVPDATMMQLFTVGCYLDIYSSSQYHLLDLSDTENKIKLIKPNMADVHATVKEMFGMVYHAEQLPSKRLFLIDPLTDLQLY